MEKTVRCLEKFYAEEGKSRENRFKSDLEDMRMIGHKECFKHSYKNNARK